MPELAFVEIVHRLVESFQQAKSLRRDARLYNAPVVGLALPGDEAALFHAVEEAGHVRVVRNHAVADAAAGQAGGLGAAKNAKDIILGAGEAGGFEELLGVLLTVSAACKRATKTRFSRQNGGRGGLERELMKGE